MGLGLVRPMVTLNTPTGAIFNRLSAERGMSDVSYPVVRRYVCERRAQIRVETSRAPVEVFVPQTHRTGDEAEVDFGDVWIHLDGVSTKVFLFSLRLSFSGKAVHRPVDRTIGVSYVSAW